MDYTKMTVEELKAEKDAITAILKDKRASAKAELAETKATLDKEMRETLSDGDKVLIKFGKGEVEGVVLRKSEKSVTVSFTKDGADVKRYRKYSEILKILAKAEIAKAA